MLVVLKLILCEVVGFFQYCCARSLWISLCRWFKNKIIALAVSFNVNKHNVALLCETPLKWTFFFLSPIIVEVLFVVLDDGGKILDWTDNVLLEQILFYCLQCGVSLIWFVWFNTLFRGLIIILLSVSSGVPWAATQLLLASLENKALGVFLNIVRFAFFNDTKFVLDF